VLTFYGNNETIADASSQARGSFFSTRLNLNPSILSRLTTAVPGSAKATSRYKMHSRMLILYMTKCLSGQQAVQSSRVVGRWDPFLPAMSPGIGRLLLA
jgi:hypothetical protein